MLEQCLVIDRFAEVFIRALPQTPETITFLTFAADYNNFYITRGRIGLELSADLKAVFPRHQNIEQDQLGDVL